MCLLVLICSGCTFLSKLTDKREKFFVHTVTWPGETVSIVAKWYTGSIDNWKQITQTNPGLDPKKMVIGDKIHIPGHLLKTTKPMPEKFVSEFYTGQKTKPLPSETATPPEAQDKTPAGATSPRLEPETKPSTAPAGRQAETPDNTPASMTSPYPAPEAKPAASPPKRQTKTPDNLPASTTSPYPAPETKPAVSPSKQRTETSDKSPRTAPQPAPEKKPAASPTEQQPEKDPVLFGPKEYSN